MLLLLACDFSAATKIIDDNNDSAKESQVVQTDSGDTAEKEDTNSPNPYEVDDDGDGLSENEGDCADGDPGIHPGAADVCDGIDNDCDQETDEDGGIDSYEPNDSSAYDLGSLEENPNMAVSGILQSDADVDRYQFTIVDDLTDFFTVTATLSNIPSGANWVFTLNRLRSDGNTPTGEVDSKSGSGTLTLTLADSIVQEDGGDYELVIKSNGGADCSKSYLLGIKQ